ncbi:lipopolysaccharide biosynthesis protein [Myroides odoratimimus]|uniref:lipopolysaccharide biosynthesis protein n=1 Tax=Myroides odoratimimus TaxID=76832 RepID=UPI00257644DD|nr:lipopolysaccharide biosynthesis protein [Myroides odoratimimus]MDM1039131.1 lipopolysaccharide biosynthesis protein [Myroides odoratimimus]MDM1053318.1 lipopolysaccharide biosynthesis protein [Myroides odoratimimus]
MAILKKLKEKSFLDLFWSFSDNILQQSINFVVGIVLARLLLPEEFGLLGIITVFMTLSTVLMDGGFSVALINRKDCTEYDYNTVFYSNIFISLLLYIVLYISSDWLGVFFDNPKLSELLRVAGLNLFLLAFSSIHRTIIVKSLNFKLITVISLLSVLISALCSIVMAYNDYGVYSLVYRILIGQLITLFLFWIWNKWRPKLIFSITSFKELFNYGGLLLLSSFLNKLHTNIYYIIIGKFFSPMQLGFYTRANTFKELASNNISLTINRVSFSTLSKIEDRMLLEKKFNFYQNVTYLITSISMLFLFLFADEIILVLLSDKWYGSIEILKILTFSGVFVSLYSLNLDYLAVIKKTKIYFVVELIGKVMVIPVVFIGIYVDFIAFLYAILVHSFLMYVIVLVVVDKYLSKVIVKQGKLLLCYLLNMVLLIGFVHYFENSISLFSDLLIKSAVFVISVLLTHFYLFNKMYRNK